MLCTYNTTVQGRQVSRDKREGASVYRYAGATGRDWWMGGRKGKGKKMREKRSNQGNPFAIFGARRAGWSEGHVSFFSSSPSPLGLLILNLFLGAQPAQH